MRSRSFLVLAALLVACTQATAEGGAASTGSESGSETEVGSEAETDSETGGESSGWGPVFHAKQEVGALMSVWGSSPAEVFVVGGQPSAGGGIVLRNSMGGGADGWIRETLPPNLAMLNWVYGVDGLVWSVGVGGTIIRREAGVWTAEVSPTDRVLWGLWGASAEELWAVGGDGVVDAPQLLRREGASGEWTSVELPPLGVDARALFKVWGSAAADVWAVGDAGAAVHWDGDTWTAHPDPAGVDLISVWGSASEGLIAVGGRASARINRRADLPGATWSGELLGFPGLNGVWIDPDPSVGATVVGGQGTILRISPNAFDVEPEPAGTLMLLHSVFGFSGGPRYAVGGSLLMAPPFVGIILRTD